MRHARRVCLLEWAVDRDRIHAAALRVVQSLSVDAMPECLLEYVSMAAQRIYTTSNAAMMWTRSSRRQTECRMVRLLVHARAKGIAASSTRSQWRGVFVLRVLYVHMRYSIGNTDSGTICTPNNGIARDYVRYASIKLGTCS